MSGYIGRNNPYGVFEKQVIDASVFPVGTLSFPLDFQAGSETSLLVVKDGLVLNPGADYTLDNGGCDIVFSVAPTDSDSMHIIYLGKELSIPAVIGNYPFLYSVVTSEPNIQKDFVLTQPGNGDPLLISPDALQVFVNGHLKRYNDDWTLSGNTVSFILTPDANSKIDFFVHGIERSVLNTVDDGGITTPKLRDHCVTAEKLGLKWSTYVPTFESFGGMQIDSSEIINAKFIDEGYISKLRLHFKVTLSGAPDNKIRVLLPISNNGRTNMAGVVNLSTDTHMENGISKWGGYTKLDIYRQFGVNYDSNVWEIEVALDFESV